MQKNNNKKDLKFIDSLITPRGQGFSQFLTGKLNDKDGDRIPDAFDCNPNDPNKDGLRDWLKRRKANKNGGSTGGSATEQAGPTPEGASEAWRSIPKEQAGPTPEGASEAWRTPTPTAPSRNGGGGGSRTPTPTYTPTQTGPALTPQQLLTPSGGTSQRSKIEQARADQQRKAQEQAMIKQRLSQQQSQQRSFEERRRTQPTKKEVGVLGVSDGAAVPVASSVLDKELKKLERQEKQLDLMSISPEQKKKLKKEIRQKKSAIRRVKRGEKLDKPIEVKYFEEQFGTISTEQPTGFKEVKGEVTRRELLQPVLKTAAAPAEITKSFLSAGREGLGQILSGGEGTKRGGSFGFGLAPTREVERTIFTPQFGTIQTNPLTGRRLSGITEEKIMVEQKTLAGAIPGAITTSAGLGLYIVPGVGEGLLASETAKSTETLIDPTATGEERTAALVEGAIATSFFVGGTALRGAKGLSKAKTAKELAALEKAETRFLSLIDDEGKNLGTIAEIRVGKNKYYSFSESSLDDTISATTGRLLKLEKKGGKVFDFESVGFSKEVPVKKIKVPKRKSGEISIVELDLGGKGSVSQSLTKFTKGESGKEMLLFSDIKSKPIKLKDLPKQTKTELGARFIQKTDDIIFVEAGKPRSILTKKGIVERTDVRTKGFIKRAKPEPKAKSQLEEADRGVLQLIKEPKSRKILKDSGFLRKDRLEPVGLGDLKKAKIERFDTAGDLITGTRTQQIKQAKEALTEKVKIKALEQVSGQQAAVKAVETQRITRQAERTGTILKTLEKTRRPTMVSSLAIASGTSVRSTKADFKGALSTESFVLGQDVARSSDLKQTTNPLFDSSQDVTNMPDVLNGQSTAQLLTPQMQMPFPSITPTVTPRIEPGRPVPPITETTTPIIPIKPKPKPKLVSGQGYNVSVKKFSTDVNKMAWQRINEKPVTKQSALGLGAEETDQTISASFKISKAPTEYEKIKGKKTKIKKKVLDLGTDYYDENQIKFRESKIRKGKKMKTTGTFIEKAPYRLDRQGELKEIRQAPRPMLMNPGESNQVQTTRIQTRQRNSVPLIAAGNRQSLGLVHRGEQQDGGLKRLGNGMNQVSGTFGRFNQAMDKTAKRINVNIKPQNRRTPNQKREPASIFRRR